MMAARVKRGTGSNRVAAAKHLLSRAPFEDLPMARKRNPVSRTAAEEAVRREHQRQGVTQVSV